MADTQNSKLFFFFLKATELNFTENHKPENPFKDTLKDFC